MLVASSIPSLFNYQRENIQRETVLKRYALLYDNIIFNRYGAPIEKGGFAENLAELVSIYVSKGKNIGERKKLSKNKGFSDIFIDCWDVVENVEKFESDRFRVLEEQVASNISNFCFQEVRRSQGLSSDSYAFDIDDVKELSGDIHADIGLNLLLQEEVNIVSSYSPIIGKAITNETELKGIPCHDLFVNELLVPDFDELSWDEIIDLRNDSNIKAFRKVVFDVSSQTEGVDAPLLERVQRDLWQLVSDSKPKIAQSIIGGFLGNLPSPIVINPIGVGLAIKDTLAERELARNYGHLFFVQSLKDRQVNKIKKS